MINRYQQGGQASGGQQEAIMQFVQGLADTLQADPKQIVQLAQQNPDALKAAVQVYQETKDMKQAAQVFAQAFQKQAQAARHGAKLNYLKRLKHQCADDEELVYYKQGGSVGCGCMKKQGGGDITKQKSKIQNIKKQGQDQATNDSIAANRYNDQEVQATRPGSYKPNSKGKIQWTPDRSKPPYNKVNKKACGSKLKKNKQGGSLNGVPFIRKVLLKKV